MTVTVRMGGEWRQAVAEAGETLDRVAARVGWPLNTVCGGHGRCGRCVVILRAGRFRHRGSEIAIEPSHPCRMLACQVSPIEGAACEIDVPETSRHIEPGRIVLHCVFMPSHWRSRICRAQLNRPPDQPEPPASDAELVTEIVRQSEASSSNIEVDIDALRELGGGRSPTAADEFWWLDRNGCAWLGGWWLETARHPLGLALDIGTTTIVAALVDLASGDVLATASDYNAQLARGADIASRITAAESPGGVAHLHQLVLQTVNQLIGDMCESVGRSADEILHVVIAGNTVMEHLALSLSPSAIGRVPFRPVVRRYPPVRANRLGLAIRSSAWVEAVPSLSGYVGGDLTADASVSGLLNRRGRWLLVDIGTNGEILFWNGQQLYCTATAAGPAFEGAGLSCGMRADAGAIERLRWRGDHFDYETIANAPPIGICGSGVVDALAELTRAQLLDTTGRLEWAALERVGAAVVVQNRNRDVRAVRIATSEQAGRRVSVLLSEADIAEALKAKAAVHAGIVTILRVAGYQPSDIDGVIVAGGFGQHLHLRNAMRIGLLPDLPIESIEVIGNGALGGALQGLGDPNAPAEWDRLVKTAEHVELNLCDGFESEFVDSLLVPHADPSRFARVLEDEHSRPRVQSSPTTSRQTS